MAAIAVVALFSHKTAVMRIVLEAAVQVYGALHILVFNGAVFFAVFFAGDALADRLEPGVLVSFGFDSDAAAILLLDFELMPQVFCEKRATTAIAATTKTEMQPAKKTATSTAN